MLFEPQIILFGVLAIGALVLWFVVSSAAPATKEGTAQNDVEPELDSSGPGRSLQQARACLTRGAAHVAAGDYDSAIADFAEAIRLNPEDGDAYFGRGSAHFINDDNDSAIADLTEAIRLNPEDVGAYFNRGGAHFASDDNDSAIADLTEAIRVNPEYAAAYSARGSAHQMRGNQTEAEADYQKARELGHKS